MYSLIKDLFEDSSDSNLTKHAAFGDFSEVYCRFNFTAISIESGVIYQHTPDKRRALYDPDLLEAIEAFNRAIKETPERRTEVTRYMKSYRYDLNLNRIYYVANALLEDKKLTPNPDEEQNIEEKGWKLVSLKDFNQSTGTFDFKQPVINQNIVDHDDPIKRRGFYAQPLLDAIDTYNNAMEKEPGRRLEVIRYFESYHNDITLDRIKDVTFALKNYDPLENNPDFNPLEYRFH